MYLSYILTKNLPFLWTFISSALLLLINGCIINYSFNHKVFLVNLGLSTSIYQAFHRGTFINQKYS